MATEIKCTCGAIWERTEAQAVRDSDEFQGTAGEPSELGIGPRIPQFRLLKASDEKGLRAC
jgi:hypothetical protein